MKEKNNVVGIPLTKIQRAAQFYTIEKLQSLPISLCNRIHFPCYSPLLRARRLSFIPVFNNMHQWEWIFAVGATDTEKNNQKFHYIPILFAFFFLSNSIKSHSGNIFFSLFKRHFRVEIKREWNPKYCIETHIHTYIHLHQIADKKKRKTLQWMVKRTCFFPFNFISLFNSLHLFTDAFVFTSFSCCFLCAVSFPCPFHKGYFFIRLARVHKHTVWALFHISVAFHAWFIV